LQKTGNFRTQKLQSYKNLLAIRTNTNKVEKIPSDCDFLVMTFGKLLKQNQSTVNNYKLLYSSFYGTTYDTNFVVSKNSNVKSAKDLVGKNVRLGQLGTLLAFKNMMEAEKISPESVKYLEIDSTLLEESLKNNKIAMGSTYFPTMQVALASGEVEIMKKNIFSTYLNSPYPQSLILVNKKSSTNKELMDKYKAIISNVLATTAKSPMALGKTLKKHTKDLGMSEWNVSDSQIEKGDEFYSSISFVTENESIDFKGKKLTAKEALISTQRSLKDANFIANELDLNTLF
jgi:hypothetical protein